VIDRRIDIVEYLMMKKKKKKKIRKRRSIEKDARKQSSTAELVRAPTSCLLFMPSWNVFGYGRGGAAFSPGARQR
jgi:hypothetical protein